MKTRTMTRTLIGTAVLGMTLFARVGQAASVTEWHLPFDGATIMQVAAGCSGVFYIDFDGNAGRTLLGTLDPARGKFTEMTIPFSASTGNDLQIRPSAGALFASSIDAGVIALVDVDQRKLTSWTLSATGAAGPRSITFDDRGRVLFLASSFVGAAVVGRLDTGSGLVEIWQVPDAVVTAGSDTAWRIVRAADGSVFLNANGFAHPAQVVRLDLSTGVFTSWAMPAAPVFGIAADSAGAVFFQEVAPGVRNVARLVPATNVLTEWSFLADGEFTQNMILESAHLFFGTDSPVGLGELDPAVAGSDGTLSPTVTDPVAPSLVVVRPVVTRHADRRNGHARGVLSTPPATAIGPFTSWGTDTPAYVAGDGTGAVYFTGGADGMSIAKLVP